MIGIIKKDNKGVTLLELVVSIALFSVVVILATQIFRMVIDGQRDAIAAQNLQESMRYAFETIGKEIRTAQKDFLDGTCTDEFNVIYSTNLNSDELYFRNHHDECVAYYLDDSGDGRLMIERGGYEAATTPAKIKVSNLKFEIVDDVYDTQSLVVMKMDIESVGKELHRQEMTLETALSSRYYE